jgi:hypothetical protein
MVGSADPAEPQKGRFFLVSPKTYTYRGDLSGGAHPPMYTFDAFGQVEWASTTMYSSARRCRPALYKPTHQQTVPTGVPAGG